jgi:hypothetical protein
MSIEKQRKTKNTEYKNIKMYKNKLIDKITKANT